MHQVYTNAGGNLTGAKKSKVIASIIGFVAALGGLAVGFFAGWHNPTKLATNYDTFIAIQDNVSLLSAKEKKAVTATFTKFLNVTGITPSFVSITNETWKAHYSRLTDYAYDKYLSSFKDESHWLIVYAEDQNVDKGNWAFEGMQGNDTANVLTTQVTDSFNQKFTAAVAGDKTVGAALNESFEAILPGIMDTYWRLELGMWIFVVVWEGLTLFVAIKSLVELAQMNGIENAIEIEDGVAMKNCPFCHTPYPDGKIARCQKCGRLLDEEMK